ncbi:hypothetical protein [Thalassovita taeanensis]|uniref:Uncharacterized protein n=1 Tax=Thalassovita taeanensis TaxID=657014 RepID=A0A1H9KXN7_9RHOB|nr:hypothetical protein [Thalassovita taeanensis]SER03916.1 hypothetical protein SAMN04488092_12123 [Thalassovita taeanensis]
MKITLIPQRRNEVLDLSRSGDTLTINGETFDLSGIPEGASLPRDAVSCDWLASDIERVDGTLRLSLILPHGATAPDAATFPTPITVTEDGPIDLPTHSIEEDA